MNRQDPTYEMLLTTGGLGFFRPASGTWGSLPPVVIAGVIILAGAGPGTPYWWVFTGVLLAVLIAFGAACVIGGDSAEARWGKDPSPVVADEMAGMSLALLLMPPSLFVNEPFFAIVSLAGAFILFRATDIAKFFPSNRLERIPAGWGILLDDLSAGIQAALLAWIVVWVM